MCDVDVSKFRFSFENFRNKKTYDLKIIIINHYLLIQIKFQLLKEMYSSNQLFVSMQHREKFRFDDENRDDELFFDNSIDYIIKQFENVFFSVFSIKIICKKSINCFFKDLFIVVLFVRWRLFIQLEIRNWWHFFIRLFFIRTRNLIAKLFTFWVRIAYDWKFDDMQIFNAMICRFQMFRIKINKMSC